MSNAFEQQQFLDVIGRDEAESRFRAALDLRPLEPETVSLANALGRVLAQDVVAPLDVPSFDRANVDGFAVQAVDTFGAAEDRPRRLRLNTETITTGMAPSQPLAPGSASAIATGGMVPRGADAVVMIEFTDICDDSLVVRRPVAPGSNITFAGTDVGRDEVVLRCGETLTSRETGVLAALGVATIVVVRRPKVAIVSTGDELIPPGAAIRPGSIHDSNSTVLADAVRELGCEPVSLGIVPDNQLMLLAALERALAYDAILLSGGTSKGPGDLSYRAVAQLGMPGIIVHGVALKPGKPLCLAVIRTCEGRRPVPVAVLPGFPTSAIFTFHEFIAPVLRRLAGRREQPATVVPAQLPLRVNSERGRTEYLLVSLVQRCAEGDKNGPCFVAYPMGKGSGSVTAFSRADGFVVIPRQREYLEENSVVHVQLLGADVQPADLVVIGSHCTGVDYLLGELRKRGFTSKILAVGSTGGLAAAKRGECDVAGIHLFDAKSNTYNRPFLTAELELIPGYERLQGIVFRRDDARLAPLLFRSAVGEERRSVREYDARRFVERLIADKDCVLVNRNPGSGTRVLIDELLQGARPAGYLTEARSHNAVAAAVAQGRADWGVAIEQVARGLDLGLIPLRQEQYDFVVPRARRGRPAVQAFITLLSDPKIREQLARRGFTKAGEPGA